MRWRWRADFYLFTGPGRDYREGGADAKSNGIIIYNYTIVGEGHCWFEALYIPYRYP